MAKKTNLPALASVLAIRLRGVSFLTTEALARELKEDRADIHRAMKILATQGWSFRPENRTAYHRVSHHGPIRSYPIRNRGKERRNPGEYDPHEPHWTRTMYVVRPPGGVPPLG